MNAIVAAAETTSSVPIIAALIAAFAAVIAAIANLWAGYRLKVKEFRVTQIKSRIDTLEQAAALTAGKSDSPEDKANEHQGVDVFKKLWEVALERVTATEQPYTKYKSLFNRTSRESIEKLIQDCNKISSKLIVHRLDPAYPRQELSEELTHLFKASEELVEIYEKTRLVEIERLYFLLNKEVRL